MNFIQSFFQNNWLNILIAVICFAIGSCLTALIYRKKQPWKVLSNDTKKRSLFSKIAIPIVFLTMTIFTMFSFFGHNSGFAISNGIVYVLCLMIFLLISDSIETFSIGNILTLKKRVSDKEKEVEKLSNENQQLVSQIISIATASITNNNHNQVIIGLDKALKGVNIESAVEGDQDEDFNNQEIEEGISPDIDPNQKYIPFYHRSKFTRIINKKMIEKFSIKNDIDLSSIQRNVKFSEQFTYGDPIMESKLIYDAYLKRPLDELFIETVSSTPSPSINYRLYYMISMVVQYAQINNKSAKFILLVPQYPTMWAERILPHRKQEKDLERLQNTFQPAIKNGFLEVKIIEISDEDCQEVETQITQNNKT